MLNLKIAQNVRIIKMLTQSFFEHLHMFFDEGVHNNHPDKCGNAK
jgi:hypothetical protein